MHFSQLPPSELVGVGVTVPELAALIMRAQGLNNTFLYWMPIRGASRSGKLFLTSRYPEAVPIAGAVGGYDLAHQLMLVAKDEARYDPPIDMFKRKGWEIRTTLIHNNPAAIAWAAWVK